MYQVQVDDMKRFYTKVVGAIREESDEGKAWRCSREALVDALISHHSH